jgi:hypothetical protein
MLAGVDFMVLSPAVLATLRGAPTMQARPPALRASPLACTAGTVGAGACCQPALFALRSGRATAPLPQPQNRAVPSCLGEDVMMEGGRVNRAAPLPAQGYNDGLSSDSAAANEPRPTLSPEAAAAASFDKSELAPVTNQLLQEARPRAPAPRRPVTVYSQGRGVHCACRACDEGLCRRFEPLLRAPGYTPALTHALLGTPA